MGTVVEHLASQYGLTIEARLPTRSCDAWHIQRDGESLVLRRHGDPLALGHEMLGRSVAWQVNAMNLAADAGWPAPRVLGEPFDHEDAWWTLERFLPGQSRATKPNERAMLINDWHGAGIPVTGLGARPGALDHLAILNDPDATTILGSCIDQTDRTLLLHRLDQVGALAAGIDWRASRHVLVHGDLIDQNVLWSDGRLTGIIDFELANVGRRITELVLTWRSRHDELVLALHRLDPLNEHEWRMLLVDWWARLVSLAAVGLRQGRQPDRWELDGLRRKTPLATALARGDVT